MFNIIQRIQSLSNFYLTVSILLCIVTTVVSIISMFLDETSSIPAQLSNVVISTNLKYSRSFGSVGGRPKENSKILFDLDMDLAPLFNWNTKQLFVQLVAEYPTSVADDGAKVTYWDSIITEKKYARVHVNKQRGKYSVWDVSDSFQGRNATVKLKWNLQPYVGFLFFGQTKGEIEVAYPAT
ncbi:Subunit of signal peptidase complex (Spc1p, Spc2p, Spc3p, Sec11p) [Komagataella phaffii GS115]|uniref:Signal peptidase subunit 3 n=2 Tax=Komagataella phaffii TaxID=460519 RepID=C4R969_KOMPG|nr:Subunit of signal peptidase complex (Spc1p, Spc2p, Spc3p, Sec11p) [Komagataella phaffii GS115]AOA64967.1 GQ67_05270T0 [Komagataella phaffii]CAY72144.1 Subunit of signal peptidase complex (Spc1p, Spc2p, Spc3p, Sec11p) [Komagataella phaffii GS115]